MATPVSSKPGWRFGVFEVDTHKAELRRSGVPLKLRDQSFQILLALLEHPGDIVTREELRSQLWPSDIFVDFDHSLNTAMMKLRDALGDSSEAPIYIETVSKRGYRFIAPVSFRTDPQSLVANAGGEPAGGAPRTAVIAGSMHADAPATPPFPRKILVKIPAARVLLVLSSLMAFALVWFRHQIFPAKSAPATAPSYRIDTVTTFRGSVKEPAITPDGEVHRSCSSTQRAGTCMLSPRDPS